MYPFNFLTLLPLLALSASAVPLEAVLARRAVSSTCPSYTIINTRGTGEAQGQSAGFRTMNSRITTQLTGGKVYNTVYSAGASQNSAVGTQDIINKITAALNANPAECFILQGYSQGAAATVNALASLTGTKFNAVRGVFLIGDPQHKAGLICNVDTNGETTTKNVNGISATFGKTIPTNWVSKTLDVCAYVSIFLSLLQLLKLTRAREMESATPHMEAESMRRIFPTLITLVHRNSVRTLLLSNLVLSAKDEILGQELKSWTQTVYQDVDDGV